MEAFFYVVFDQCLLSLLLVLAFLFLKLADPLFVPLETLVLDP